MTHRINAVYEKGVFRPVEPITLEEGAQVAVEYETTTSTPDPKEVIRAIDEIAALPCEGPDDGFSAVDADKVLYGGEDAR